MYLKIKAKSCKFFDIFYHPQLQITFLAILILFHILYYYFSKRYKNELAKSIKVDKIIWHFKFVFLQSNLNL